MIRLVSDYFRDLGHSTIEGWNRFWFSPSDPATLCLLRILCGAMLLYTHLVWSIGLEDFFLPTGWITPEAASVIMPDPYAWSYFWWIKSAGVLWTVHIVALVAMACMTLGFFSRTAAIVSYLAAVAYVNRVPQAQFGLDQANLLVAMYLWIGPCGACYSVDAWRAHRRGAPAAGPTVSANLAIRLIQIHMCVVYFFAGLSKLQGQSWWQGSALWGAVANLEYQSMDLTWLAGWPLLVFALTSVTVFWELFFCVLVWIPKIRPVVIALAVPLHLGIAFGLGMITFGLAMLTGCASFISPRLVRMVLDGPADTDGRGGEGVTASREPAQPRAQQRRRPPTARASKLA